MTDAVTMTDTMTSVSSLSDTKESMQTQNL